MIAKGCSNHCGLCKYGHKPMDLMTDLSSQTVGHQVPPEHGVAVP